MKLFFEAARVEGRGSLSMPPEHVKSDLVDDSYCSMRAGMVEFC
jgi:hypothetical protein